MAPALVVDEEVRPTQWVESGPVGALGGKITIVHPMFHHGTGPTARRVSSQDPASRLVLGDLEDNQCPRRGSRRTHDEDTLEKGEASTAELKLTRAIEELTVGIEPRNGRAGGAVQEEAQTIVEEREIVILFVIDRGLVGAGRDRAERPPEVVDPKEEDCGLTLRLASGGQGTRKARFAAAVEAIDRDERAGAGDARGASGHGKGRQGAMTRSTSEWQCPLLATLPRGRKRSGWL
jgi:hypothetical protein